MLWRNITNGCITEQPDTFKGNQFWVPVEQPVPEAEPEKKTAPKTTKKTTKK